MSVIHCDWCGRMADTDFEDHEVIDGFEVCENCLTDMNDEADADDEHPGDMVAFR